MMLTLSLTIELLQLFDVVEYSAVIDDQQRKDNEVMYCYDCRVAHNQFSQLCYVLVQR